MAAPTSRAEYVRLLAEWEANSRRLPQTIAPGNQLSINELLLADWQRVEEYYRHPDGRPTSEVNTIKQALRPLRQLYGHTRATEFNALALAAVRNQMIAAGRCRTRVNKDIARIKGLFKWAAAQQLVPLEVYQSLRTLEGLRKGRSAAREAPPVRPVAAVFVEATLPFALPPVAAMARLQLLTGMRPGEVVLMRGIDLDRTGKV